MKFKCKRAEERDAAVMCLAIDAVRDMLNGSHYDPVFEGHIQRVKGELSVPAYRAVLDGLKDESFVIEDEIKVGLICSLRGIRREYFLKAADKPKNPYLAWEKAHPEEVE